MPRSEFKDLDFTVEFKKNPKAYVNSFGEEILTSSLINNTLIFNIITKDIKGNYFHPDLKAKYLFRLMIEHFGINNIREVKAEWHATDQYSDRQTNTNKYTEVYNTTGSERTAAESTWTGSNQET